MLKLTTLRPIRHSHESGNPEVIDFKQAGFPIKASGMTEEKGEGAREGLRVCGEGVLNRALCYDGAGKRGFNKRVFKKERL